MSTAEPIFGMLYGMVSKFVKPLNVVRVCNVPAFSISGKYSLLGKVDIEDVLDLLSKICHVCFYCFNVVSFKNYVLSHIILGPCPSRGALVNEFEAL